MKHTRIKAMLAAAMLAFSMTGCSNSYMTAESGKASELTAGITAQAVTGTEPDAEFIAGQTAFALSLLQQTAKNYDGKNVLLSPYSLMQALAMAANGADGQTRSEMEQVLGGLPVDALNSYLYTRREQLPAAQIKTANSVWWRNAGDRLQVNPAFLQTAADYYAASAYQAPFDDSTVKAINDWCSKHTDGMIPELLDQIDPEVMMYLINAVSFDAKWETVYEEEPWESEFTAADGSTQQMELMWSDEHTYLEDAHATGFLKPYENGDYAFAAILPEEGMTPEAYLAQLTPEGLRDLFLNAETAPVEAGMPKFSYAYEDELSKMLSEMGMPTAFEDAADFKNMAVSGDGNIAISRVLHKTFISVDTEGTKAAAISAVEFDSCAPEVSDNLKTVLLDRPFVYMIVDTNEMLPVFAGILNSIPS